MSVTRQNMIYITSRTCFASEEKHNKARRNLYIYIQWINKPIWEIYFHLRQRKKNCASSSLVCRVSVHFCAARKETRRQNAASYFFDLFYKSAHICFYSVCTQIKANLLQSQLSSWLKGVFASTVRKEKIKCLLQHRMRSHLSILPWQWACSLSL